MNEVPRSNGVIICIEAVDADPDMIIFRIEMADIQTAIAPTVEAVLASGYPMKAVAFGEDQSSDMLIAVGPMPLAHQKETYSQ